MIPGSLPGPISEARISRSDSHVTGKKNLGSSTVYQFIRPPSHYTQLGAPRLNKKARLNNKVKNRRHALVHFFISVAAMHWRGDIRTNLSRLLRRTVFPIIGDSNSFNRSFSSGHTCITGSSAPSCASVRGSYQFSILFDFSPVGHGGAIT
jgi:hypothetical protein